MLLTNEYAAGFFDGEGSVLIYKRTTSLSAKSTTTPYQIRSTITNTNREIILAFQARFDGNVIPYAAKERRRPAWKWTVLCRQAATFLEAVHPHLRIKHHEAMLALDMQRRIGTSRTRSHPGRRGQPPLAPEEIAERDWIWTALQNLRRRPV